MSRHSGKIQVPDELRDVLLEFTISCLLEQPPEIVSYGVEFFTNLREKRKTRLIGATVSLNESLSYEEEPLRVSSRRLSICSEGYNPENDETDGNENIVYPKTDEQRARLEEAVKNISILKSLDSERMNIVLDAMNETEVQQGEWLIKQGDNGDKFYVVDTGVYEAYIAREQEEPLLVRTYDNSGIFGELALLYSTPRAASVKAVTGGRVWELDRHTFRRICLKGAFQKRKKYESLIGSVSMLENLEPYERLTLADALETRNYENGERIISQGSCADGMYFVEEGDVLITMLGDKNQEIEVTTIGKGGYFGEVALITHKPRAASAYAVGNVQLAFLDVEAFERLLGPCMQIMKRNIDLYDEQLTKIFGSRSFIKSADLR